MDCLDTETPIEPVDDESLVPDLDQSSVKRNKHKLWLVNFPLEHEATQEVIDEADKLDDNSLWVLNFPVEQEEIQDIDDQLITEEETNFNIMLETAQDAEKNNVQNATNEIDNIKNDAEVVQKDERKRKVKDSARMNEVPTKKMKNANAAVGIEEKEKNVQENTQVAIKSECKFSKIMNFFKWFWPFGKKKKNNDLNIPKKNDLRAHTTNNEIEPLGNTAGYEEKDEEYTEYDYEYDYYLDPNF